MKLAVKRRYCWVGSGRAGSLLDDLANLLMVVKFISIFSDFFYRFYEATHIWLLIGTSFVSLTRNKQKVYTRQVLY